MNLQLSSGCRNENSYFQLFSQHFIICCTICTLTSLHPENIMKMLLFTAIYSLICDAYCRMVGCTVLPSVSWPDLIMFYAHDQITMFGRFQDFFSILLQMLMESPQLSGLGVNQLQYLPRIYLCIPLKLTVITICQVNSTKENSSPLPLSFHFFFVFFF